MTSIQSNTEYDYNTTTIQMGFRRKSNDLFESVSQEFTLLIYVLSCRNFHLCRRIMVALDRDSSWLLRAPRGMECKVIIPFVCCCTRFIHNN